MFRGRRGGRWSRRERRRKRGSQSESESGTLKGRWRESGRWKGRARKGAIEVKERRARKEEREGARRLEKRK
eukprot:6176432-Pleurochrysis_carterae.AAC.3